MAKVQIETSARHVHVTQETLEALFGKGATLTPKKELSQPGQYACAERIDIVGPKRTLSGVSILGPCRGKDHRCRRPCAGIRRYRRHPRLQAGGPLR